MKPAEATVDAAIAEVLTAVCNVAVRVMEVDHSGLVIFSPDRQTGKVVAEYPDKVIKTLGLELQLGGHGSVETLIDQRRPIISNDVRGDESLEGLKNGFIQLGIKSIVIVPIVVDGHVRGSFSFDSVRQITSCTSTDVN